MRKNTLISDMTKSNNIFFFSLILILIYSYATAKLGPHKSDTCPQIASWLFPVQPSLKCGDAWCDVYTHNDDAPAQWYAQVRFPAKSPFVQTYGLSGRPFFYNSNIDKAKFTWKPLLENSGLYIIEALGNARLAENIDSEDESVCHYSSNVQGHDVFFLAKRIPESTN